MSESFIDSLNVAAFPIIAVDAGGKVIGKNLSAYKYIPKLRLGCSLYKNTRVSDDGMLELTCESQTFKTAIRVDVDGTDALYMFPTQIQNGMFKIEQKDARNISLTDISRSCAATSSPNRLYKEIASAFGNFDRSLCGGKQSCDLINTLDLLKKRLSNGFRALGYSVHMSMTDDVRLQRFFEINVCSLVYTVMRSAYIAMRLSQNGTAELTLNFDERTNLFTVASASMTKKTIPKNILSANEAISYLVPEISLEMKIDAALGSAPYDFTCSICGGIFTSKVMLEARAYTDLVLGCRSFAADKIVRETFYRFSQKVRKAFKK